MNRTLIVSKFISSPSSDSLLKLGIAYMLGPSPLGVQTEASYKWSFPGTSSWLLSLTGAFVGPLLPWDIGMFGGAFAGLLVKPACETILVTGILGYRAASFPFLYSQIQVTLLGDNPRDPKSTQEVMQIAHALHALPVTTGLVIFQTSRASAAVLGKILAHIPAHERIQQETHTWTKDHSTWDYAPPEEYSEWVDVRVPTFEHHISMARTFIQRATRMEKEAFLNSVANENNQLADLIKADLAEAIP